MFTKESKIGFIGAGMVGQTLALSLFAHGYNVCSIASRTYASAESLSNSIPGCDAFESFSEAANSVDFVFITTTDDSIQEVVNQISWRASQGVVHCSGSGSVDVFSQVTKQGVQVGTFHPLQAFTTLENSLKNLSGSTYAIEGTGEIKEFLAELAICLGGHPIFLNSQDKPLYHASVVMMGGLFQSFAGAVAEIWETFGIDKNQALKSLVPITKGVCDSLESVGVPDGLAGPYVRGDVGTIEKHIDAVRSFAPHMLDSYCHIALVGLEMCSKKGKVTLQKKHAIKSLLTNAITHQ